MFPESPVCTLYDDTKRNGFWVTGGEPGVIEVLKVWKWPIVHRSKFWPIYVQRCSTCIQHATCVGTRYPRHATHNPHKRAVQASNWTKLPAVAHCPANHVYNTKAFTRVCLAYGALASEITTILVIWRNFTRKWNYTEKFHQEFFQCSPHFLHLPNWCEN